MPDETTSGSDRPDDEWDERVDPEPDDGFDDQFDGFMGDRSEEFDHGPESVRSRGRLLVGASLLVLGLIVVVIAVQRPGKDEGGSTASGGEPDGTAAVEQTTTTATQTIVPTTLANGALPTGCGNWDPAFSFDPQPIEGIAVYSDFEGWHVVLAPDGPEVVTGTVKGQTTPVVSTEPQPEGVQLIADPSTQTVTFRLTAGDAPIGFDFAADCSQKQLTIDLKEADGSPVDLATVRLGRNGGATSLPVIAQRQPTVPG
jgi:hypothetical protein